jgi:CIC family chloride channel protein
MIAALCTGWVAAIAVILAGIAFERAPNLDGPLAVLLAMAVAIFIQRFFLDRWRGNRRFDGPADLMIHIHSPVAPDSPTRWFLRAIMSAVFNICGAPVGPEGAAIEAAQGTAMRVRSSTAKWFEQRRRTDAACALSAGIGAAFGAPMAGVLIAMELGVGGRTLLSAISAFTAYFLVRVAADGGWFKFFDLSGALYEFRVGTIEQAATLFLVAVAAGVFAALLIRFSRDAQNSLIELTQDRAWIRGLIAGLCLVFIAFTSRDRHASGVAMVESVLSSQMSITQIFANLGNRFLGFVAMLAGFGTMGIFWPVFTVGSLLGVGVASGVAATASVGTMAGLVGAAALWSAVLGSPLGVAVLAFELTRNVYVLIPCFLGALIGREVRKRLGTRGLLDTDLDARGIKLLDGRSASILVGLKVADVMVRDHETVQEREPISELHSRLMESRYQFLPVVNAHQKYTGLLTAEMVHDAWLSGGIGRIFEAKDVLYRVQFKAPTVRASDDLTVTAGLFSEVPCVAVVDGDQKVQGLIFAHAVRVAYEREVARRSLLSVQPAN